MKYKLIFLVILTSNIWAAAQKELLLYKCSDQSDEVEHVKKTLTEKAVNVLNVVEKEDQGSSRLCVSNEKILAVLIWSAEQNRALRAIPSLQVAPEGFSIDPPKRVH